VLTIDNIATGRVNHAERLNLNLVFPKNDTISPNVIVDCPKDKTILPFLQTLKITDINIVSAKLTKAL
jgi:hypothetical protein